MKGPSLCLQSVGSCLCKGYCMRKRGSLCVASACNSYNGEHELPGHSLALPSLLWLLVGNVPVYVVGFSLMPFPTSVRHKFIIRVAFLLFPPTFSFLHLSLTEGALNSLPRKTFCEKRSRKRRKRKNYKKGK